MLLYGQAKVTCIICILFPHLSNILLIVYVVVMWIFFPLYVSSQWSHPSLSPPLFCQIWLEVWQLPRLCFLLWCRLCCRWVLKPAWWRVWSRLSTFWRASSTLPYRTWSVTYCRRSRRTDRGGHRVEVTSVESNFTFSAFFQYIYSTNISKRNVLLCIFYKKHMSLWKITQCLRLNQCLTCDFLQVKLEPLVTFSVVWVISSSTKHFNSTPLKLFHTI